jgi:hypothetical protein
MMVYVSDDERENYQKRTDDSILVFSGTKQVIADTLLCIRPEKKGKECCCFHRFFVFY